MSHSSVRPEDVLPDEQNSTFIRGINVRKGTVAAVLRNAEILASPASREEEKQDAWAMINALAPGLVALGLHEHVIWKNPDIQALVEATARSMD